MAGPTQIGISGTMLIHALKQKLGYLQASAFETSRNIAQADIPGVRRREIRPFQEVLKRTKIGDSFALDSSDIVTTGEQIQREKEVLDMTNISMEYQGLMSIYKRFHDMVRLVIGRG